jgi:hypothetical protein
LGDTDVESSHESDIFSRKESKLLAESIPVVGEMEVAAVFLVIRILSPLGDANGKGGSSGATIAISPFLLQQN